MNIKLVILDFHKTYADAWFQGIKVREISQVGERNILIIEGKVREISYLR